MTGCGTRTTDEPIAAQFKVSIVTISYNQAPFLEQAMRSVIEQEGVPVEYIVVDPGSTDGSREIIERYRHQLARVIFEPDRGPADGLNKGFAAATGDLFGFLNSDDYLLPNALTRVRDHVAAHPGVSVVSGHALIVDGEGRPLRRSYSDRYSARMDALGASVLMQPSTFFRADAFRRVGGFNPNNRVAWDGELFFRMHRDGAQFELMDEMLSAYRVHESSITGGARLDIASKEYFNWRFNEAFGHCPRGIDWIRIVAARMVKHLRNWRGLRERALHGRIYGRGRER